MKRYYVPYEQTNEYRHSLKKVHAARKVDDGSDASRWTSSAYWSCKEENGEVGPARRDGVPVIRLRSRTTASPNRDPGNVFGEAAARLTFPAEDWREWNRLTFEVYPDFEGFRTVPLLVLIHNDGAAKMPDYTLPDGRHSVVLHNGQWNTVTWEIPHENRDAVTGLSFAYRLQGNEPGAAETIALDVRDIRLEVVQPDHVLGWLPAPGELLLCHPGYLPDSEKTALSCGLCEKTFRVIDTRDGSTVFTGEVRETATRLGGYQLLDFSALRRKGRYLLRCGEHVSHPFQISPALWRGAIEKAVHFFTCQRCGCAVEGLHDVCHQDILARHGDEVKAMGGGWHDAADLSQSLLNTSEAAFSLLSLSQKLVHRDPELSERMMDEALWGYEWVLRTRFRDGYRLNWQRIDIWTDNLLHNDDDVVFDATRNATGNLICAKTEAYAARVLRGRDPGLAVRSLRAAREDYAWGREDIGDTTSLFAAAYAVNAAAELYRATGDDEYLLGLPVLGDVLLCCQQVEPMDWELPLKGFFYTTAERTQIDLHTHGCYVQAIPEALWHLCTLLPDHPKQAEWVRCAALFGDYLLELARLSAPYDIIPTGIYTLSRTDARIHEDVRNGIRLDDDHYIRIFPPLYIYTGNNAIILSYAVALLHCYFITQNPGYRELACRQVDFVLGRNPFNQSMMYGEGYNFTSMYATTTGNIVGSIPVGMRTLGTGDEPYWPQNIVSCPREVWVHPAGRFLWLMEEFYAAQL